MSSPSSSSEQSKLSNDECEIYSSMSFRYGSEEELHTDDPFWEFIDKLKVPSKRRRKWEGERGEDEDEEDESEQEEEDQENEEANSDYDDDDEDD